MPEINHKFRCVEGAFKTETGRLICVPVRKYAEVDLCFAEGTNITFAQIKLHSSGLFKDAEAVFDDASSLGNEIAHRWNTYAEMHEALKEIESIASDLAEELDATNMPNSAEDCRRMAEIARVVIAKAEGGES